MMISGRKKLRRHCAYRCQTKLPIYPTLISWIEVNRSRTIRGLNCQFHSCFREMEHLIAHIVLTLKTTLTPNHWSISTRNRSKKAFLSSSTIWTLSLPSFPFSSWTVRPWKTWLMLLTGSKLAIKYFSIRLMLKLACIYLRTRIRRQLKGVLNRREEACRWNHWCLMPSQICIRSWSNSYRVNSWLKNQKSA